MRPSRCAAPAAQVLRRATKVTGEMRPSELARARKARSLRDLSCLMDGVEPIVLAEGLSAEAANTTTKPSSSTLASG